MSEDVRETTRTWFTPGPWKYDHDGNVVADIPYANALVKRGWRALLGRVSKHQTPQIICMVWGGHEANRHLLLHAPELYAACEKALSKFEQLSRDIGIGLPLVVVDLRAALALARGESPIVNENAN